MGELATEKHVKYIISVEKVRFPFIDLMLFSSLLGYRVLLCAFKVHFYLFILCIPILGRFMHRERMIFNLW